jgi:hypothetical protein
VTTALLAAGEGLDPNSVSPGLIGFLATFGLVVVSILLFVNMSRRLRRMSYREEHRATPTEEERRAPAGDEPEGQDGAGAPGEGPRA